MTHIDAPEDQVLALIAQVLDPTQTEQELRRTLMFVGDEGFVSRERFSSPSFREKVAGLSDLYERDAIMACFAAMELTWENWPDLIAIGVATMFANMNPSIISKETLSRFTKNTFQEWRRDLYVLCSLNVAGSALFPLFELGDGAVPLNALKSNCAAMISTLRGSEESLEKAQSLCLAACGDDEILRYTLFSEGYFLEEEDSVSDRGPVYNVRVSITKDRNDATKVWDADAGYFGFIDDWVEVSYPDTSWIERYLVLMRLEQGIADQLGLTLLPHPLIALL